MSSLHSSTANPSATRAARILRLRNFAVLGGLCTVSLLLVACPSARPIKYYGIEYPATAPVAADAVDATLMVRPFEASHLYLDDKIVYGFDSPEMGTYDTQRWSEPPVELLQIALMRGLRASGRFRAVYMLRGDLNARFVLGGHLYDFKEIDADPMKARLSYEVRLWDRKTSTSVWNHMYNYDEPASEKTIEAFAAAMNKNVERSVQEIASGLDEYFRSHPIN